MSSSSIALTPLVLAGLLLCLPEVRAFLVALAQRRYYDEYMSRPRYRFHDPRTEGADDPAPEQRVRKR